MSVHSTKLIPVGSGARPDKWSAIRDCEVDLHTLINDEVERLRNEAVRVRPEITHFQYETEHDGKFYEVTLIASVTFHYDTFNE